MGNQSREGSSPIAAIEAAMVGNRGTERVEAGGVQPEVLHSLFPHPLGHGPADHVARSELVDEAITSCISQQRAMSSEGFGQEGSGHGRVVERGRVELHELHVGDRHSCTQCHGQTVGRRFCGIGGHRKQLAGASGREHRVGGAHVDGPSVRAEGAHAAAPAALDEQIEREPLFEHRRSRGPGRVDQCPLDFRTGGGAAGMDHPCGGVAALTGQRKCTARPAVEDGAHRDQLTHP